MKKKILLTALFVLALATAAFLLRPWPWHGREDHAAASPAPGSGESSTPATPPDPLRDAGAAIGRGASPAETRSRLALLRDRLKSMPPEQAVAFIRAYLERGDNINTGLEFGLGRDRKLSGWPSLRVFLIDVLEDISPSAAVAISRDILTRPSDPDEWAAAMKNIGRHSETGEDAALLAGKAREMLGHEAWSRDPSVGYLEAFDVIVHTRDAGFVPALLDRCGDRQNRAVRHASFLALDRLVQYSPVQALELLVAQSADHAESPEMIANMVARADVRDPDQKRAVETYLLDPRRNRVELASFASVFPNANQVVSVNLITTGDMVSGMDLKAIDRASLETVQAWLADPRFANLGANLQAMEKRIASFVR